MKLDDKEAMQSRRKGEREERRGKKSQERKTGGRKGEVKTDRTKEIWKSVKEEQRKE